MVEIDNQVFIDLVTKIKDEISNPAFIKDFDDTLKGNKSAAARARKKSVELSKLFKQFRADSVALAKELMQAWALFSVTK